MDTLYLKVLNLDYEPGPYFTWALLSQQHLYRCVVDGRDEFQGQRLPVGTYDDVLKWINARYKFLGEISMTGHTSFWWLRYVFPFHPQPSCVLCGEIRRFLVEVAEGVEKVFVLHPVPDGLLEWHPGRALTCTQAQAVASV